MGSAFSLLQQVQSWLESTRISLSEVDPVLQEAAQQMIFARVGRVYDTTLWVDQASTPVLVTSAEAMLIAAWYYDRQYSEVTADEGDKYSEKLETLAENLIVGICNGEISLDDSDQATPGETPDTPDYIPSDANNAAPMYDALGNQVSWEGQEDIKFRIGQRW